LPLTIAGTKRQPAPASTNRNILAETEAAKYAPGIADNSDHSPASRSV
jgi:hypothetical protein